MKEGAAGNTGAHSGDFISADVFLESLYNSSKGAQERQVHEAQLMQRRFGRYSPLKEH